MEPIVILEDSLIERNEGLVSAEVGEATVIMSLDTGYFYQLNRVASQLWKLLETPSRLSPLCESMQEIFDIDKDTCRRDLIDFLLTLRQHGVLRIAS